MKKQRFWDGLRHYGIIGLVALFVLLPYYWMIIMSVKPTEEVMLSPPTLVPSRIVFDNYVEVWSMLPLLQYIKNSLWVAGVTTILCIVCASLCGYSLSRWKRRRLQKGVSTMILLAQLIPGALPMIAMYFMIYNAGLTNTYTGLILAYTVWGFPFCTLMMRSYFSTAIPISLEESATIDGCSRLGTFFRIALPISVPGLMATAIYSFILAWNEFMWASIILSDGEKKPVSIGVYSFVGQYGTNTNVAMTVTTGVLITIPSVILFGFLQKYLVSGLTAGAVKE